MRFVIAVLVSFAAASVVHLTASRAEAHDYRAGALEIGHPLISPTPAGRTTTAAYLTIHNTGATGDRLVSASSPQAARIEIHETRVAADQSVGMAALPDGVPLLPGARVRFAPGGLHLMVIGLAAPLAVGDEITLTLVFERAGSIMVRALCERPVAMTNHAQPSAHDH